MREIRFGNIVDREQLNSRFFILTGLIFFIFLTGYLISNESYFFLGVLVFVVLILGPFRTNPGVILIYLLTISIPFSSLVLFSLNKIVPGVGDVPVHTGHILAIMLIIISAIRLIPKIEEIKIGKIGKTIFLIVVVYCISIIGVYQAYQNFTEYFKSLINMLLFAMLYFVFTNSITRHNIILKVLKIWVIN